jgi:hypothetical protein
MTPASTLDHVIAEIDAVIARSILHNSRVGLFAALYRCVTLKVKEGIADGRFDDGPRMEHFDVVFANRYLDALQRFQAGQPTTDSWKAAFETCPRWRPILLQHLLLGMNAHINLDLGMAAATSCPGLRLPPLQRDFNEINNILSDMLVGVQLKIGRLSPLIGLLDRVGGRRDEVVLNFSMKKARDAAWSAAVRLAPLKPDAQEVELAKLDKVIAAIARRIQHPGRYVSAACLAIRLFERTRVSKAVEALNTP